MNVTRNSGKFLCEFVFYLLQQHLCTFTKKIFKNVHVWRGL